MQIFTSWPSWAHAEGPLSRALPAPTVASLRDAFVFARRMHGLQQRPTGRPYVEHLLEALEVAVSGAGLSEREVLVAIVLHDVLEDTPCTEGEIARRFGPEVAALVRWVSKPVGGSKADYLAALLKAPPRAVLVKLSDRVSNVQELHRMTWRFQRRYYLETVAHIMPLAGAHPWFAEWFTEWRLRWQRVERWPGS
ncbi:HD domain-containing protein [Nonomuraea gerenzanensis]|uniref:GTP pyrophosphokinase, (P)ppGpp synthetase II / Guanosine-3',5'-bis(Diphosphate) 3'-pyrophosphohydrolase n=1 Tax=Nonomuraea gerenzanensis TaxID=93944 RepID=A0A1M4EN92_9ACTN|nr:HD domain-containing protein [Nonomuraea gerenzanensis]UBU11821.1 HD domain-containing protein [Nonomuraea gerenzanensis]SBP00326.1 GTP pyrophosphokinase, (p)ppGpp synthetase II / Guanosine-3',5'-bis(diphosphate) 3'-pyrophosphohydrolase [Nonomuraea gerenzanensis]